MGVVGDDDGSFAKDVFEAEDEVAHVASHDGIDHGGGFIVQDGVGILGKGARDGDGALHTGGEFARQTIEDLFHFQHFGVFLDVDVDVFGGEAGLAVHGKGDVFCDREGIEEGARLKDHGDFAADSFKLFFVEIGDIFAIDEDLAGVGCKKAHDVFQGNGFAYAATAHDYAGFSLADFEADVVENHAVVEGFADIAKFKKEFGGVGVGSVRRHFAWDLVGVH